ncbi:hypothetical protein EJ04DRAFT_557294 [Polyplosphaeria fusca]|uniref:Protein kinase domain-containing protein n=1 Tax=Polyplosphaeria fusca TaxID=682080 RepID=A0A9P4QMJ8_9PLEO|nr:hypothetical protein EJ04DRAFT_557294 [Polyplosphaeria fusca]
MPASSQSVPALHHERDNVLENAFARLPRPQRVLDLGRPLVPTKMSLMQAQTRLNPDVHSAVLSPPVRPPAPALDPRSSPSTPPSHLLSPPINATTISSGPSSPRKHLTASGYWVADSKETGRITLGKFVQDGVDWVVRAQQRQPTLVMVKRHKRNAGIHEKDMLERIQHDNIVKLNRAILKGEDVHLEVEYCRFTLREVLHVHLKLAERQIQYIAQSVFQALSYLIRSGIAHNAVALKSIRISVPDMRIVLCNYIPSWYCTPSNRPVDDFQTATLQTSDSSSNHDLADLGLVLLECMEGRPLSPTKRTIQYVKEQRALNKVFGINHPEPWSGCKQLIDFLDELFNAEKSTDAKISRPHQFVIGSTLCNGECLRPYAELITFECFTLWTPDS